MNNTRVIDNSEGGEGVWRNEGHQFRKNLAVSVKGGMVVAYSPLGPER